MTFVFLVLGIILSVILAKWALGVNFRKNDYGQTDVAFVPKLTRVIAWVAIMSGYVILTTATGEMKEGSRGVVLRMGRATGQVIEPGFYMVTPLIDKVVEMDVTVQAEATVAQSASVDLQVVTTEVTINYHVDPANVAKVYSSYRSDITARVIRPAIQEAVKAATARYKAEELITKRAEAKGSISEILTTRLQEVGLIVDAVNVTDFDFSDEFNRTIESKVTALQEALKATNELERIKVEAEQRVTRAKAEADSVKLDADAQAYALQVNAAAQAEALRLQKDAATPDLIQLRRVEAMLKALEKWDGKMPTYVGASGAPVPILDVFQSQTAGQ